ncbi:MAG: hypothetical protein EXR95_05295 [Gemmatimonadetes bacterium]|nr:hypothetical protein [Gemmatimonadota bacterium]
MLLLPLLGLALLTAACDEQILEADWTPFPDTVVLYSLARPELSRESAYNFALRSPVRLEVPGATGEWDVALDTRLGQLVLLPPGVLGVVSRARVLALPGQNFRQVEVAPADTMLYSATLAVPLALTTTYVIRTDSRPTQFGGSCVYFAKLQPLALDVAEGRIRFVFDASPVCNDRRLVPPDSIS